MTSETGSRILALVTEAYGGTGGIAQFNKDLFCALSKSSRVAGVEVLPRHRPEPTSDLPPRIRQHMPRRSRLKYSVKAAALAIRFRPDVIFCGHLYMASLGAFLARCLKAKLIVQVHGIEIWRTPSRSRRWSLEQADLILCVSRDSRSRVIGAVRVAPERVMVVPNTVAEDYGPGEATHVRDRLGLGSAKIVLSVGRLDARERYKGHDLVIPIVAEMRREGRELFYLVAGDGDDRARLEEAARTAGISDRVRFLGYVPRDHLPDLYRAADLFVLPSRGEGFGIVFLEAMACGTPALGLSFGGAVDALDGLGKAVAPADLATSLRTALDEEGHDRQHLSALVRGRFGRARFEQSVAAALDRVCPRGERPVGLAS